jgi:hypothetical protein
MIYQHTHITYNDNKEYRQALRTFFEMDLTGSDDETIDEMLFDNKNINSCLDNIYNATYHYPLFIELYQLAAGCFLSTDEQVGLTVLFSYDYFSEFYSLLYDLHTKETVEYSNEHYIQLRKLLKR